MNVCVFASVFIWVCVHFISAFWIKKTFYDVLFPFYCMLITGLTKQIKYATFKEHNAVLGHWPNVTLTRPIPTQKHHQCILREVSFHMTPILPMIHDVLGRCHFHVRSWPHCWPQFEVNGSDIPTKSHTTIKSMDKTSLIEKIRIFKIGQIWKVTGSRKGHKVTRSKNDPEVSFTFLLDAPACALLISYRTFFDPVNRCRDKKYFIFQYSGKP